MSDTSPPRLLDGPRFAFGTLTVLRVRVHRWDREAARAGMLCAPLAGLAVGGAAALTGAAGVAAGLAAPLAAVAAVAVPAVLTRALHLDGLADTADGLGSGRPADEALRIMKRSDIGPFGVVTLLLALAAQAAALAQAFAHSPVRGAFAALLCAVTARLALVLGTRAGVPAARPEGLGAAVAGAVPRAAAVAVAAAVVLLAAGAGALSGGPAGAVRAAAAVLVGCLAAEALLRRCVRRFGGVTGDVLGGLAETAATVSLIVLCLG
ncbi:adenosylcobinamide-GDP ribazoletransferase [Streptomyces sp. MJP52]|uniref:adenosylcobinamide-GDP ribazoletransferase n=1 Tax=Streptomyces sp. MJP52 TaxID=2940555 RepID=UPI0024745096|nr:adenosylcobinamide-GDP ribazoletransferase [Streptomyces sp. MJP52]MDH6227310.1 adenosylcobinamide-GDP ribazoletransferase [Streptomyces sp. MJP52]